MRDHRGFSLVEALVATSLLAGGLMALAHVLAAAAGAGIAARHITAATMSAAQKIEELHSGAVAGASVDYVDSSGAVVGTGALPPAGAVYRRRLTLEPLVALPGPVMIHVHVEPLAEVAGATAARHQAAHVVGVLSRAGP